MRKLFFVYAFILVHLNCFSTYYSQVDQDRIIHSNFFSDFKGGVFVDIGAYDGINFSNSYFFEKELGWTGLCIEPIPEIFEKLVANRKCRCIQGCVTNHSGTSKFYKVSGPSFPTEMLSGLIDTYSLRHVKRMNYEMLVTNGSLKIIDVKCYLLNDLLKENGLKHINLLSIDTEGGEFEILSSIDYSRYKIDVITVEDNYNDSRFIPFMKEKGFELAHRAEQDLIFVNKSFKPKNKK